MTGWKTVYFDSPVQIAAASLYVASYHAPNGHYSYDSSFPAGTRGTLTASGDLYQYGGSPNGNWNTSPANYWVDVVCGSAGSPVTYFSLSDVPANLDSASDTDAVTLGVELGLEFSSSQATQVVGVRFYQNDLNVGPHAVTLRDVNGNVLAFASFSDAIASSSGESSASLASSSLFDSLGESVGTSSAVGEPSLVDERACSSGGASSCFALGASVADAGGASSGSSTSLARTISSSEAALSSGTSSAVAEGASLYPKKTAELRLTGRSSGLRGLRGRASSFSPAGRPDGIGRRKFFTTRVA